METMPEEFKLSHRSRKRVKEVKRKARPGLYAAPEEVLDQFPPISATVEESSMHGATSIDD